MAGDSHTGVKPNLNANGLISSLLQLAQLTDFEV